MKSPPNFTVASRLPGIRVADLYIVSQACMGVAANVSPIPVYPCAANHGAPQAPGRRIQLPEFPTAHDVVHVVVLRGAIHGEPRNRERSRVQLVAGKNVIPGNNRLLRQIIEVRAEAGQIFRGGRHAAAGREAILCAEPNSGQRACRCSRRCGRCAPCPDPGNGSRCERRDSCSSPLRSIIHHHVRHGQYCIRKASSCGLIRSVGIMLPGNWLRV